MTSYPSIKYSATERFVCSGCQTWKRNMRWRRMSAERYTMKFSMNMRGFSLNLKAEIACPVGVEANSYRDSVRDVRGEKDSAPVKEHNHVTEADKPMVKVDPNATVDINMSMEGFSLDIEMSEGELKTMNQYNNGKNRRHRNNSNNNSSNNNSSKLAGFADMLESATKGQDINAEDRQKLEAAKKVLRSF